MKCPKCGEELHRSKKDSNYGLCDKCRKKFKLVDDYDEDDYEEDHDMVKKREGKKDNVKTTIKGKEKKKGGGIIKSIIIAVIALVLICALFGNSNDKSDDSTKQANTQADPDTQNVTSDNVSKSEPESEQTDSQPSEEAEEHYEVDLSAGNYTAGVDIPVGTYNLVATGGSGNVSSSNMFNGGLNEVMGNPADEYSIDSFSGLKMDDGIVLTLGGTVTLHLVSENAKLGGMTARSAADATPIDLGAGNYTCGNDFPPGTYNVVATGGNGNVNSDNMFSGGLNEIMGTTNDGLSIAHYNNAVFENGNTLSISGTSVQLIPVGE